ncbi:MAG: hypothetical protein U0235_31410 [Polyangiaceae bacterium]
MKTTDAAVDRRGEEAEARATLDALDESALVVAMVVVPALYSRNKMFNLFSDPRLRRARKRAIALRTAIRQLASGAAESVRLEPSGPLTRLTYDLPRLHFTRTLELTPQERACVVFSVDRERPGILSCSPEERAQVERTLSRLTPASALASRG